MARFLRHRAHDAPHRTRPVAFVAMPTDPFAALRCGPPVMRDELLTLLLAAAHRDTDALDAAELAAMCLAVQMQVLERLSPDERWALLAEALMAPYPSHFFSTLRACAGLQRFLPELDALFGVPQLSDLPEAVDVGLHQLRLVDETAQAGLPLAARFAALMHKIGKGGTPREIWPSHYKHEQRAHDLLERLPERFAVPADALALAHWVVDECEHVHRVSDMRAGAIAALLERLQALDAPERFGLLLDVCRCDYAAYPGHNVVDYPKAPRLRRALAAYASAEVQGLAPDDALQSRALAISEALRSYARLS
jgi:tRNA nucleotidyltransferase (CCA-adding enzyme)